LRERNGGGEGVTPFPLKKESNTSTKVTQYGNRSLTFGCKRKVLRPCFAFKEHLLRLLVLGTAHTHLIGFTGVSVAIALLPKKKPEQVAAIRVLVVFGYAKTRSYTNLTATEFQGKYTNSFLENKSTPIFFRDNPYI